jgi:hypothetical protein
MDFKILSLLLTFCFLVALFSITYAFKNLENNSRQTKPKTRLTKNKIKYKEKFLKSVKDLDLNV